MRGRVFQIIAIALAVATSARADDRATTASEQAGAATTSLKTFGSAAAYGGVKQSFGICFISNVGAEAVKLKGARIYDATGAVLPSSTPANLPNCDDKGGVKLAGGRTCAVVAAVKTDGSYSCATRVETTKDLRGTFEIIRQDNSLATSAPLE